MSMSSGLKLGLLVEDPSKHHPAVIHLNYTITITTNALLSNVSQPDLNPFTPHSHNNKSYPSAVTNVWHRFVIHVLTLSLLLLDMRVRK